MLSRFLPLILCIIFLYGGYKLVTINEGKTTESVKEFKKTHCENSVMINAMIQEEYTRVEMESATYFEYKFDYEVDGKKYSGDHTVSTEMTIPIITVYYNKNQPNVVSTDDPCLAYKRIKDSPIRYPDWIEYVGIGMVLLGLGFGRSSIVRAIRGTKI
ncbi:MAG: hypothetical protein AB8F94_19855 [Saprospiraceae bacterium]